MDQPLHGAGGVLICQAGYHVQRDIDPRRDPRRTRDLAIDRPALLDVACAEVLEEARVRPMGGDLAPLQQPDGGQNQRAGPACSATTRGRNWGAIRLKAENTCNGPTRSKTVRPG